MDTTFTFPRPQAPIPRPKVAQSPGGPPPVSARESNALRASVLDAALELGLGNNSIVAGWMFNNSLPEEDEEEPVSSPGLAYGSSATSEESSSFALSPSSSAHSSSSSSKLNPYGAGAQFPADKSNPKDAMIAMLEPDFVDRSYDNLISESEVAFPQLPPVRPTTPGGGKKLKKKHRADGYDTDGGYLSESGKKKDKKAKKSDGPKEGEGVIETEKEAKKRAKEEKKEMEQERKRTKSLASAAKAAKKAESKEAALTGYDTDGAAVSGSKSLKFKSKKAKTNPTSADPTAGYETDGYQSSSTPKKSKTRFFKLSSKSKSEAQPEIVPPLPPTIQKEKEVVPLPIAERFATTFSPSSSLDGSSNRALSPGGLGSPSAPLPPLSFQSFESDASISSLPILSSRSAPVTPPINRDSLASTGTTSSNGSLPQARSLQSNPSRMSEHGGTIHGNGSGSFSTITSASHPQNQNEVASETTNMMFSPTSSKISLGSDAGSGSLRPPVMSFPNSRSPSPNRRPPPVPAPLTSPPIVPLQIFKTLKAKASLDNFRRSSRNPSPSPVSPVSPYIMVPPNDLSSTASSPTLGIPSPMQPMQTQWLQSQLQPEPSDPAITRQSSLTESGPRSRSPSAPLGASLRTLISSPNTAMYAQGQGQRPPPLSVSPPAESSSSPAHLTTPNVLAYYDIPPPSPPPMGPLPHVPLQSSGNAGFHAGHNANILPSPGALRQRIIDRTPRQLPPEFSAVFNGQTNILRGRESPFPSRPIPVATGTPSAESAPRGTMRRYRDVYAPNSPGGLAPPPPQSEGERRHQQEMDKDAAQETKRTRFRSKNSFISDVYAKDGEEGDDDDASGSTELHDVLDRFEDTSEESAEARPGRALERSRSFEALLKGGHEKGLAHTEYHTPRARVPDDIDVNRNSEYQFDDGRTVGDRTSRWSGSIYSRNSMLDEDTSGETRDRLLKRVEAMMSEAGQFRGEEAGRGRAYVPPVPRIPDAYASRGASVHAELTPGRSWNRF